MSAAASLLAELIRCPSVTPDAMAALDVVEAYLTPLGFVCTRLRFDGRNSYPVDNLFATRGTGGRHLLFAGHVDVVPPGDETDWSHPPFGAEIDNGIMFGRGAVDMKSGIACFCAALAEAVAEGGTEGGTISLAITGDEEADSINGTDRIMEWAEAKGHRFDFAIVGEPSSAQRVVDRLKTGRRGSLNGRIALVGRQGHSAYPDDAINPLPVLTRIAAALTDTPLDEGTKDFQPSKLVLTSIDTGNKASNVIPGKAELKFNIRFSDLWSDESLRGWLHERIASIDLGGCEMSFDEPVHGAIPFVCPPGEAVALLDKLIAAETGAAPEHSTTGGTSDARYIAKYCPVVECGLVGASMHQTDERVPLADLAVLTRLYRRFISAYLGG
ncbi:MAG: succinyl-diaminopimelate desuccinylase [Alphaproteobacteria bacterium]|nr:succinyl-diaminopimelate desuccinylase [Alphaproteobacteria bacterium]